jgi:hypothetical protein
LKGASWPASEESISFTSCDARLPYILVVRVPHALARDVLDGLPLQEEARSDTIGR